MNRPKVLIVGCGFGGLEAAKALRFADVAITILDRNNHHLFQPLLYQVATAGLSAPAIAAPIRHIFRKQKNVQVLLKEVSGVDAQAKQVTCSDGEAFAYDYLILATGATHSYFGNDHWATHAPGLKTLQDALTIRQRVLMAFEQAEDEPSKASELLNFIVIGAGPTGVEMAGTLAEIARHTLKGEFRQIDPSKAKVILLEGGPKVLGSYVDELSVKAKEQLHELGVEVRLNAKVTNITERGVHIGDEFIPSICVVWAAGVKASPLGRLLGVASDKSGRVPVQADLRVASSDQPGASLLEGVYVVGDLASATTGKAGEKKPVPGVSPSAKQMGRCAAANILREINGQPTQSFQYADYGALATIGRRSAVVDLGWLKFSGFPAWLFWLFVHVYFLIGFRNRLMVMIDWCWSYFSFDKAARIIRG